MTYIASNNGMTVEWKDAGYVLQAGEVNMGANYPTDAQLQGAFTGYVAGSLVTAQNNALLAIDIQAGNTRLKYITDVPGQADTYIQKAADAAAYKTAGYPLASLASYPWVQAEAIAINGATPTSAQAQAAADSILTTQTAWIAKGTAIERERRIGKIAVAAATTIAAINAAMNTAITILQAL